MSTTLPLRRRLAMGVATTAVAALAVTGCSASQQPGASGDTVTLNVMYKSGDGGITPEMIDAYEEEHPNVKITFIDYDATRLSAMLASGDSLDIAYGKPNANLFAKGVMANLDDYIAKSDVLNDDTMLAANDLWKWDGTEIGTGSTYGIVKDWSLDATIWQNKALFESAGVEPLSATEPADWDELLEKAKQLKAAGVAYPLNIEWPAGLGDPLNLMIAQQGASMYEDDGASIDLQSPEAIRAIQWFVDYGKAEVGPTALTPLTDGTASAFIAGQMAMTTDGYWFGGNLTAPAAAEVAATSELVPAPTFGERISPIYGGVGAFIPEASKNKDAAWEFMEYFMAGQPSIDRAKTGWGMPLISEHRDELPVDLPFQQQALDSTNAELEYLAPLPVSPYVQGAQINQVLSDEISKAIQGTQTVKETAEAAEKAINAFIEQGKDQLG